MLSRGCNAKPLGVNPVLPQIGQLRFPTAFCGTLGSFRRRRGCERSCRPGGCGRGTWVTVAGGVSSARHHGRLGASPQEPPTPASHRCRLRRFPLIGKQALACARHRSRSSRNWSCCSASSRTRCSSVAIFTLDTSISMRSCTDCAPSMCTSGSPLRNEADGGSKPNTRSSSDTSTRRDPSHLFRTTAAPCASPDE